MEDHINNLERDRDREGNDDDNIYLTGHDYPGNRIAIAFYPCPDQELVQAICQFMQIMVPLMQNNNELLHQVMQISNNINNQMPPGTVVPNENVQIQQLDQHRDNPGDGISNLLALYVGAQGAIFNAVFFEEGRKGCELLLSRFILTGLVSVATIVAVLQIFFQQFTVLRDENYWSWVAQKATFVVMLIAFSVFLLLSCTSVLCVRGS